MTNEEITPEFVRTLWGHLEDEHRSKVIPKAESWIMKIASRISARRTSMTREEFLTNYATTIGRRIYLPFELGVDAPRWSLRTQALLGTHEHTHVVQWRERPMRFWYRYATDTRARALYEAEAYLTEYETAFVLGLNDLHAPEHRVQSLHSYGLKDGDIEAAREYLLDYVTMDGHLRNDKITTTVGQKLARWRART